MSRPRVAFDARHARDDSLWGSARYARALLAALQAAGDPGLEVEALGGPQRMPEAVWEQALLPAALRRGRYAAVHAPNCFLPLRRPCPGIVTIHDLAFEDHARDFPPLTAIKYRRLVPRAARSAERVICVSEFTAADVCRRYGVARERARVVAPAPVLAAGGREPPRGPYLLAVSALRSKKNLVRLVDAVARLRRAGAEHRLIIAGPDLGMGARLRARGEDVEVLGAVAEDELDALIRGAEALVHPSLYEGFGLVVVEAMARGCPVVAARATALPETASDAAEYFDPLDVADMAGAIERVVGDPSRREDLVRRGRERAAAFSWDRAARETLAVYREAIAGGAGEPS